jgi:hypothetical protein
MNEEAKIIESQIRECYGRVVYSHKTHEKCADILLSRLGHIKLGQIVLSALTTGGILSTFFGSGNIGAGIGVVLSTVLLVLNAYTKDYDMGEIAQKHKQAASDLWIIREEFLSLLTDIKIGDVSLDKIRERRDALTKELHVAYAGSPNTNYQGYKKAQEALQKLEDMTFLNAEIDAFLPQELKRGNNKSEQRH